MTLPFAVKVNYALHACGYFDELLLRNDETERREIGFSWQTGSNLANLISYLSGFNVAAGYKVDPLFSRVPSATYVKEKTHPSPRFLREAN